MQDRLRDERRLHDGQLVLRRELSTYAGDRPPVLFERCMHERLLRERVLLRQGVLGRVRNVQRHAWHVYARGDRCLRPAELIVVFRRVGDAELRELVLVRRRAG